MNTIRHCERSEAIHDPKLHRLPRYARSDESLFTVCVRYRGRFGWLAMTKLVYLKFLFPLFLGCHFRTKQKCCKSSNAGGEQIRRDIHMALILTNFQHIYRANFAAPMACALVGNQQKITCAGRARHQLPAGCPKRTFASGYVAT